MRLLTVLLLSLCSGCNALTGASELEPVECTVACGDASGAPDVKTKLDTGLFDTTADPDTSEPMEDTSALCTNGVRDALESDVDCGGPCPKCVTSRACNTNADCASDNCVDKRCARCGPKMALIASGLGKATSYCIDAHEVTNADYKTFLDSSPKPDTQPALCSWNATFQPTTWPYPESQATFPVRWIDWCDALAYCTSKNKRLCGKIGGGPASYTDYANASVDVWFYACSLGGTRTYPYGSTIDHDYCNSQGTGPGAPVAVGSHASCTNTYGTFDMSGNVSEWEDSCTGLEGATDTCRVRGGSFKTFDPKCSVSEVYPRQTANDAVGIRCCDD